MTERARNPCDVVVVGAGPAGIAAALAASSKGKRVHLLDEGFRPGGQIWRHRAAHVPAEAQRFLAQLAASSVHVQPGASVFDMQNLHGAWRLAVSRPQGRFEIDADSVILACGARERFLPFPGWTLPGVTGAGGGQALLKEGLELRSEPVLVAGTGPLLLPVAAAVRKARGRLLAVLEQTPRRELLGMVPVLSAHPAKALQAARLGLALLGVPYRPGWWVAEALGTDRLEAVRITNGFAEKTLDCRWLFCGFGLVPNLELALGLGCEMARDALIVDGAQRASVQGIFAAGEVCGIAGVDAALTEGTIAGLAAAGAWDAQSAEGRRLARRRAKARWMGDRLDAIFSLRPELRALPRPDTTICRCEDVPLRAIDPAWGSRETKLCTRRHGTLPGPGMRADSDISVWARSGFRAHPIQERALGPSHPGGSMIWKGVFPAVTTPFTPDLAVDHAFLARHLERMLEGGAKAFVMLGSLGEGATLTFEEKVVILETTVKTLKGRVPVVAGIPALSTAEAVALAEKAKTAGCQGLMVLPPYVYKGDARETEAHYKAVLEATELDCLLYNNPVAYGTDVLPGQILALAQAHPNLKAVKESSGDARRFASIRALLGDRLALFVGMDDLAMEGFLMGAQGWIAGLVNALPEESVKLLELVQTGRTQEAFDLYAWFLPLLRLDTHIKFVQYIKLAQQEVELGSERVRPPRLELVGQERDEVLALIRERLARRPLRA